jgi:hypothetical protein
MCCTYFADTISTDDVLYVCDFKAEIDEPELADRSFRL